MSCIQLTQEDAGTGREEFCVGPGEVSGGADQIGENKESLWRVGAKSEHLPGRLQWILENCHSRWDGQHFLQCSINRADEGTFYFRGQCICGQLNQMSQEVSSRIVFL